MSLYQQEIIKRYAMDSSFKKKPESYQKHFKAHNPMCGDRFDLYLSQPFELSYDGDGCMLSKASTAILCEQSRGSTPQQLADIYHELLDLLNKKQQDCPSCEALNAFKELQSYPLRHRCVLLAWENALRELC